MYPDFKQMSEEILSSSGDITSPRFLESLLKTHYEMGKLTNKQKTEESDYKETRPELQGQASKNDEGKPRLRS